MKGFFLGGTKEGKSPSCFIVFVALKFSGGALGVGHIFCNFSI